MSFRTAGSRRRDYLADIDKSLQRSHEQFIDHFYENYSNQFPPLFVMSEILTLGCMKHIYDGSPEDVQRAIANEFKVPPTDFSSWLLCLNATRNICAHHGRFWNRSIIRPAVPSRNTHPGFHDPVEVIAQPYKGLDSKTVQPPTTFAVLSICNFLLSAIDPGCGWAKQVKTLLEAHPKVRRTAMGFPSNWTDSPVWHDVD